jgi:N-acetylmuramoyl-L-alanine amidase
MKVKNRRRRKRKLIRWFALLIRRLIVTGLIVLTIILGCYIFQTIRPMLWGQVDIVLDAGHGGEDPGAIQGDAMEKEITLDIVKMTKDLLEESGYKVGMTREEDCRVELGDRASFANKRNAQVFVSIHCNASENHKGNGIETYHTEQKGLEDKMLAEMIQKAVIEQTDAFDRGIKAADYTVIVRTTMPAVLIEVGFLTDEVEKNMLQDKEYQQKLAKGIVDGIVRYLNR